MLSLRRYRSLLPIITPPLSVVLTILVLMLAENGLALASPWLAGQFTHALLDQRPALTLSHNQILALWFALFLLQSILAYSSKVYAGVTSEKLLKRLRNHLYSHLQDLPVSYFHQHKHGETLTLLHQDCSLVSSFISNTVISLVPLLLMAGGALLCIALISPPIALLAGLLIPLFYLTIKLFGRNLRPLSRDLLQQYATIFAIAEENLATLPILKSFCREELENRRFQENTQSLFSLTRDYLRRQALLAPLMRMLAVAIIFSILWLVSDEIASGTLSTAEIISLLLYGMLLTQPISRLADIYGLSQRTFSAAERLVFCLEHETEDHTTGTILPPLLGDIVFQDVTFAYPGRKPVLNHIDLHIPPGETLAITGENGAGKSTLAHLLLRFHSPNSGTVSIDGYDLETVSRRSLRSQIGLVQQQVLLQNASVRDNILFGNPNATEAEIRTAAKAAQALPFIEALPDGFATLIGDQGVKLSGGQKQRLSLARTLLKNPAILILDEATAMFDPEGEASFIQHNHELLRARTVIIITHRPASLALADRVLRLENGTFTPSVRTSLEKI